MPYVRKTKRRASVSRRLKIIIGACASLAVLLLFAGMYLQHQETLARNAAEAASYSPERPATTTATPPSDAAFIGDSYVAGGGASSPAEGWAALLSDEMNWKQSNHAIGGTGYFLEFEGAPNYAGVIPEVIESAPEIVVVGGGQNDFSSYRANPAQVEEAITATYVALREGLPDARIIAVGPSTPNEIDDAARGIDEAVQQAAESVGAEYVSLLDPNVIEPAMVSPDGQHVGNTGHAAIAERVRSSLN